MRLKATPIKKKAAVHIRIDKKTKAMIVRAAKKTGLTQAMVVNSICYQALVGK